MKKLAIITSHPIQYNAPWFRHLAARGDLDLEVFYLWDFGVEARMDPGFQRALVWDVPLLDGYAHELVPNTSRDPGTHHFTGLRNPSLGARVAAFDPEAVLLLSYNYLSTHRFLWTWSTRRAPLLFRGDSHRLLPRSGPKELVKRALIAATLHRFDAFLYVGQANRRYFRHHGVPEEKLFFAPHAVDNARFTAHLEADTAEAAAFRGELGIPEGDSVLLFAGKLDDNKRVLDLLAAFLAAGVPQSSLLFVGNGPVEAELRARAAGQAKVFFAPFQNQSKMPRTYLAGDLVALVSERETWGLAINEAMAMGRAVIVADHIGCAEDLVTSGDNGLVVPTGDLPALTAALRSALVDRARLRAWGERGRARIAQYSYEQTSQGLVQALERVARTRSSGPRGTRRAPRERVGS
jgi:glycosyltransferase involved in cell wall biosynthesis